MADRYRKDENIVGDEAQDEQPGDISESDDSSERASHGVKRGGNNHFGSTGILKCLTCRKRKGKCEYIDQNEACRFCADRSLECGTKLSAKGARAYELSQQLLILQREAGLVPFPDVSKLSAIAAELERRFPNASVGEIYAMAKPTVESAVAVAGAGQSRNDASSVLFGNSVLGDTTPKSIHNQLASARHTPVPQEIPFRTATAHLPQQLPARRPAATAPYDLESWFSTIPPINAPAPSSTDFPQFQGDVSNYPSNFFPGLNSRGRQQHQHPSIQTDEGEIDYSSLFHH